MKKDILELELPEIEALTAELGEKKFRAAQLYSWLHEKLVLSFSEMTNLSKSFREKLESEYTICSPEIIDCLISEKDGTRKYILGFEDGNVIETVLMKYHHGNTVCVSSQAGCRMGCRFCASTIDGLSRNLTAAEILSEVYTIERDLRKLDEPERVSNIVIMGSGEPLDNFDEAVRFIRLASAPGGLNISMRNITLSTCGLAPEIRKLADLEMPITLALSLHASTQEKREEIMPVSKMYSLKEVFAALKYYYDKTGRRLTFEYSLLSGVNDTEEEALRLAALLKPMHGHVNLIPVNPVTERDFTPPDRKRVYAFQAVLNDNGVNATVRREMGRDIDSACGQLRRRYISSKAAQ